MPAGVAIMIPVLVPHLPGLRYWQNPIDGGRSWRGKRLLGDNKTWRGLVIGTAAGTVWACVQLILFIHSDFIQNFSYLDYTHESVIWLGFTISLGALLGDAVGSFLKRQRGIAPGSVWFPYDQWDFVFGGLLLSLLAVRLPLRYYLIIPVVWLGVHMLFGFLGYLTRLQDHPI